MYKLHPKYKHTFYGLILSMDTIDSQLPDSPFEIGERVICFFVENPVDTEKCLVIFCTIDTDTLFRYATIQSDKLKDIIKLNGVVKSGHQIMDFGYKLNIDI